jgi:hypothetical protein
MNRNFVKQNIVDSSGYYNLFDLNQWFLKKEIKKLNYIKTLDK